MIIQTHLEAVSKVTTSPRFYNRGTPPQRGGEINYLIVNSFPSLPRRGVQTKVSGRGGQNEF